jgi:hypothetical protein
MARVIDFEQVCVRCRALNFDDARWGGFESSLTHDGEPQLEFANSDGIRDSELVYHGRLQSADSDHVRAFELDYHLEDRFPDLPIFSESSANGCQSCDFIKAAILSRDSIKHITDYLGPSATFDFEVSLEYWWQGFDRNYMIEKERQGLSLLAIRLAFEGPLVLLVAAITLANRVIVGGNKEEVNILCLIETDRGSCLTLRTCSVAPMERIFLHSISGEAGRWLRLQPPTPQPLDEEVVRWMRSRVDDCLKHEHTKSCSGFCPDRLLDVSQEPARLVMKDSGEIKSTSLRYAALTYCWGSQRESQHQLRTDKSTLPLRCKGILDSEMTPVLRDAVRVTRALSIPYLWIDCLCVLQDVDDPSDWNRQCWHMDEIYGCAEVTIRPLASGSCLEGFLTPSSLPTICVPFQSSVNDKKRGSYKISVSFVTKNVSYLKDGGIWMAFEQEHRSLWKTRGWTLQEYVLSARVLSFGRAMVLFDCPTFHQQYGCSGLKSPDGRDFRIGLSQALQTSTKPSLHQAWNSAVIRSASTRTRGFSKLTDILPALSGQAKVYKNFFNAHESDYVAGLWRQSLAQGLMWRSDFAWFEWDRLESSSLRDYLCRLASPQPYIAPSWSWASAKQDAENEVLTSGFLYDHSAHPKARLDAWTEPLSKNNPFGRLRDGSGLLRIRAPACQISKQMTLEKPDEWWKSESWVLKVDEYNLVDCYFDWKLSSGVEVTEAGVEMIAIGKCKGEEAAGVEYRGGAQETDSGDGGEEDEVDVVYGLLIHPSPNNDGKYLRVGIFITDYRSSHGYRYFDSCPCKEVEVL